MVYVVHAPYFAFDVALQLLLQQRLLLWDHHHLTTSLLLPLLYLALSQTARYLL